MKPGFVDSVLASASEGLPQEGSAAPIFVIGCGRSGTTLLRMMLCAHPRIYLTHEAFFYVWDSLVAKKAEGTQLVETYLRSFNFRWLGLSPHTVLRWLPRQLRRHEGWLLYEQVMRSKAQQQGKVRFGDKTPAHSAHLAQLFRDFPDARVIRIVRDPRAVAQSLARMPWSSATVLFSALLVELEHRQTTSYRDRLLQVRLEDLLADPRKVMGAVLSFVGEPFDEKVLDHATHGPGPEDLPPLPWFSAAAEPRASGGPPSWMRMDGAAIRLIERIARGAMTEGGYARAELEREPARLAVAAHAARELGQALRDLGMLTLLLSRGRKHMAQLETPEQQALFRRLNPAAWRTMPGFTMPPPPPLLPDWAQGWGAALAAAVAPAVGQPPARPPSARSFLTPLYAGAIALEPRLGRWLPLRFPRDLRELMATPKWLQEVLQRAGALPAGSEVAEVRRRGGLQNEPDKERTAAVLDLVMRGDASRAVTPVFVKFQTGRGMPLWLQAVRAAIEPGVAREVDFYRCLAGVVPLRAPRPYYADAAHAVNRVCLVLEHVDGYNPADWRGCPLPGVRAMLAEVARMNAVYLGRTANDPATAWIPAKVGLDYASFVDTLAGTPPAWYRDLWQALVRYFRHRPITLVHGDCRPGNMLFRDDGRLARGAQSGSEHEAAPWPPSDEPPPEVVFADWEAVNAAPLLWDFTYCTIIGLRVADRRVHLDRLLAEFLSALRAAGAPESLCDPECSRAEVDLLALVLYYIAALVLAKGYWDRQGNTLEDFRAWSGRVLAAVQAVDAERAAAMLGVAPGLVRRLQREAALLPVGVSRAPDRSPAASRLQTADPITVGKILATRGDAGWLALHERYGRVFRYRGGVVTSEPEDFQALLSNRVHTQRRSLSHRLADRFVPGAPGILFKDGEDWLLRLRALMPSMQPQAVAAQEARLRSVVEAHVAAWPADYSGPDLFAEVTTLGLKIALSVGANLDLKDPLVQELGAVLRAYKASTMRSDPRRRLDEFGLSSRKLLHLPWIAVAFHEFAAHMRRLERLVEEIIRRQPWADPARQGWLQLLHAAGLRGSALASELNHLYGAFTAADYTTTCALAELAHAPEWVARLRAECEADPAGPELPVAEAILRETARRYPVAMVIYRELGATMKLGGELFPSGTQVMVLPYALHHDAALWQRPLAFDPGRWHSELPARTAAAYAPFLRGPRRCIGQDFASQQLRIVLHALLRRHELTVDARPVVNPFIIPRLAAPLRFLCRATRNTRGTARQ